MYNFPNSENSSFPKNSKMSDETTLVMADELDNETMNGMLINVAPFNGVENIGFESDSKSGATRKEVRPTQKIGREIDDANERENFIVAIFVVVFDTKHGKYNCKYGRYCRYSLGRVLLFRYSLVSRCQKVVQNKNIQTETHINSIQMTYLSRRLSRELIHPMTQAVVDLGGQMGALLQLREKILFGFPFLARNTPLIRN